VNFTYYDLPVFTRIAFAVVILALLMITEVFIKKEKAFRWKGYALWLTMAVLGLIFGFLLDLVTIRISPEYYRIGKGVTIDNIWMTCLNVGGAAGFLSAALVGGIILIKNKQAVIERASIPWEILKSTKIIFGFACALSLIAYSLPLLLSPNRVFLSKLSPEQVEPFFRVQQVHAGAYLGALIGFLIVMSRREGSH
jgi:hypothetical protein